MSQGTIKKSFPVSGMTCASCAASVESILSQLHGVDKVAVNFASNSVLVEYQPSTHVEQLKKAMQEVGYDLTRP